MLMALFHSFLTAEEDSIIYMHHIIFFTHSSVVRQLGCLPILAIVNSAAVNRSACIFLNQRFVWIYAQEWLDPMVILFLSF